MREKKWLIYGLVLIGMLFFIGYPIYSSFITGTFSWHISTWALWKDFIELIIYMALILLVAFICKNQKGYVVLILSSVYLLSMGTFFQCLVSYVYIEVLIFIGKSFLSMLNKDKYSSGVNFVVGSIVWGSFAIIMSIFKHGNINCLRIMTIVLVLLACIVIRNKKFENKFLVIEFCKYLNKVDIVEFLINLLFVLVMLVSCARVNTHIESDSNWYALHTDMSLFGSNSFYDFLGYTGFIHYYPKFKELLMAPITGLGLSGYLISSNLWIMVLCLIEVKKYLDRKVERENEFKLCVVFLIFSTVAIVGIASTAKSDALSYLYMVLLAIYMDRFLNEYLQDDFFVAISAGILAYTVKYTSFLFATIILVISLFCILKKKRKIRLNNKLLILALMALVIFVGIMYRTFLITGYPTYSMGKAFWDAIGFRGKLYFDIIEGGVSVFKPQRLLYVLFDVEKSEKIMAQWMGNYFLFYIILLFVLLGVKNKIGEIYMRVLSLILTGVSIYYLITMQAPDGNYFGVPIIIGTTYLFVRICKSDRWMQYKKMVLNTMVAFILLNFCFVFVTHPSWGSGTRFSYDKIELYKTDLDDYQQNVQIMKYLGIYEIEESLKEEETPLFIISDGATNMCGLSARVDLATTIFNTYISGADINCYEDFVKYINYVKTDGFIISNTDKGLKRFDEYVNRYVSENGYCQCIETNQYIYYRIK